MAYYGNYLSGGQPMNAPMYNQPMPQPQSMQYGSNLSYGMPNQNMQSYQQMPQQNQSYMNQPPQIQQNIPQSQFQSNVNGGIGSHGVSTADIVWVTDEQEVIDYPVSGNSNMIFMDMNRMKMYTKEGGTNLIRDFDLCESQESIQRYQQMKQIQNAQFPVIETTATVVDPEEQRNMEQRFEQRFNVLEQKISHLMQNLESDESQKDETSIKRRSMTKK